MQSYILLLSIFLGLTTQSCALFAKFSTSASRKIDSSALKTQIRELSRGTQNGIKASEATKKEIASVVAQLEKANRVKNLSSAKQIDGSWKLLFTTNEGSSAGKLGPFVGDVVQAIDLSRGSYINYVKLPLVEGALRATWDNVSPSIWKVKFQSINFKIGPINLINKPLTAEGIWKLTYIDDDFRILYAKGGGDQKEKKENLYILEKWRD